MYTQGYVQAKEIVLDNLEGAQKKVTEFLYKNSRKLSALSMASKMAAMTVVFAFLPLGGQPVKADSFVISAKLDTQNRLALSQPETKVEIAVGESNELIKEREEKEAQRKQVASYHYEPQPVSHSAYEESGDPFQFRPVYMAAANQFGIPWQLIEAVHEVESGKSGSTSTRSYAGAMGPMQFMPGTWRTYGIDGDGDGSTDATNVVDAIYGAAHLLARSGADEGRIDDALFNYNHAQWYVDKVKTIAYEIGM